MDASLQYALLGSDDGVSVTEARLISRDDKVIAQVSSEIFQRNDGVWVSSQAFRIPNDWEPGTYAVEQSAETKNSRVFSVTRFTVR